MEPKTAQAYSVCYTPIDTTLLGRVWIAARSGGVFFLNFSETEREFLTKLDAILDCFPGEPEIRLDPTNLSAFLEALLNYFNHQTQIPEELPVQIDFLTEFQQDVLSLVKEIPMGSVTTYGDLAKQTENEYAARAVGQVLRRNPLPIIIPCHRVVRSGGSIGGYGGILGSERKIALLKHEGVILT
jgi:methylated-DNA-[protein]-cysteine S-methyltransferase